VKVARQVGELEPQPRAVALGTFDGVHLGHRQVLDAALAAGRTPTVVTFDPHPRVALGYGVELLVPLERRLELLAEAGIQETLVVAFDLELAQLPPDAFAERILRPIGTEVVLAGSNFRFGRGRAGDLALLEHLGFDTRPVPLVAGVSSTRIRDLLRAGEVEWAAKLLGRPAEVAGTVVAGDARGGTLGYPTANLRPEPGVLIPGYGIYAGAAADGHRAAISIGTNPHYGGDERRIEAFLLDFAGDLYGKRLTLELWRRLRDEQAFDSEAALVAQIDHDVEAARRAKRPG
jgi:riboflavin kinase/FMN adenylyltransferase